MPSRLTALQGRVLELLSGMEPAWTLTGGAALAGIHLGHRTTRDLDLFWHGLEELGTLDADVMARLRRAGLDVAVLRHARSFERLRVSDGHESVILDLIAEPVPNLEAPISAQLGHARFQVDTPHEILVNKLCTLLDRSEVRDLLDIRELLARGGDLDRALADAPRKNSGFSPLTMAWLLRDLQLASMAEASGLEEGELQALDRFRDELLARVARSAAPEPES